MKPETKILLVLALTILASFGGILNRFVVDGEPNIINGIMLFTPIVLFFVFC
jgi:hypothetical protein